MPTYLSKFQYKNYEQGEFTGVAERTLEEITAMIRSFPWAKESHNAAVGLTAPSVTIEGNSGSYIKVSHHYNNKYCLYLLRNGDTCSKKVVADIEEAISVVSSFCLGTLDEGEFTPDNTFQAAKYFITKKFVYYTTKGALFRIIMYTIMPAIFTIALPVIILFSPQINISQSIVALMLTIVACALPIILGYFTIMAWRLYFNHYNYSREQFIEISAGRNEFVLGTENDFRTYKKDEIEIITVYRNKQSKNPWSHIELFEIKFKNRTQINISGLLLKHAYTKFPGIKMEWVSRFFPRIG